MAKHRENGEGPLDRWTLRLTKEDQAMFVAVNNRLKRSGITHGTKMEFFRHCLKAAFKGLADFEQQDKIREALQAYEAAQAALEERKRELETLVNAPQPSPEAEPALPAKPVEGGP
jgi:hypothetical protein